MTLVTSGQIKLNILQISVAMLMPEYYTNMGSRTNHTWKTEQGFIPAPIYLNLFINIILTRCSINVQNYWGEIVYHLHIRAYTV